MKQCTKIDNDNMNILITGCNGQLGQCLQEVVDVMEHNYVFTDLGVENKVLSDTCKSATLDITNYDDILKLLKEEKINMIINCAAYTNVDAAEDHANTAYVVNTAAVDDLARAAAEVGAKMIHISTDYVFSGTNFIPYKEDDFTNPINMYGQTKRDGENRLFERLGNNGIVIRTAWLYSNYGKNFVKTMLNLGENNNTLKVIFDQIGTPTYAIDLARVIKYIINSKKWVGGIYHFTNEGVCSWYDFAKAIMEIYKLPCEIIPVHSEEYKTKVKRPYYSVLDKTKIKETYGVEIRHWREALTACLMIPYLKDQLQKIK